MSRIEEIWQRLTEREPEAFTAELYKENTKRMIFLGILLLLADTFYVVTFGEAVDRQDWLFNIAVLSTVALSLPVLIYVYARQRCFTRKRYRLFVIVVTMVMMMIAVWFTLVIQVKTDRITPYLFSLVAIMVIVQLKPAYALLVVAVVEGVFIVFIHQFQANADIANTHAFNSVLMSIIVLMLSFYTYSYRKQLFNYVQMIEAKSENLSDLSVRDSMTGLYNYKYGYERLQEAAARYERNQQPFSILLFDIDDFKRINDQYGHVYGDQAIMRVVAVVRSTLRQSDIAVRYGGDEFLLIFINTTEEQACKVAHKLSDGIVAIDDMPHSITISGGVREYMGQDVEAFVHQADQQLYRAKAEGKNSVHCSQIKTVR